MSEFLQRRAEIKSVQATQHLCAESAWDKPGKDHAGSSHNPILLGKYREQSDMGRVCWEPIRQENL